MLYYQTWVDWSSGLPKRTAHLLWAADLSCMFSAIWLKECCFPSPGYHRVDTCTALCGSRWCYAMPCYHYQGMALEISPHWILWRVNLLKKKETNTQDSFCSVRVIRGKKNPFFVKLEKCRKETSRERSMKTYTLLSQPSSFPYEEHFAFLTWMPCW